MKAQSHEIRENLEALSGTRIEGFKNTIDENNEKIINFFGEFVMLD